MLKCVFLKGYSIMLKNKNSYHVRISSQVTIFIAVYNEVIVHLMSLNWVTPCFLAIFTAFCYITNLYGMRKKTMNYLNPCSKPEIIIFSCLTVRKLKFTEG